MSGSKLDSEFDAFLGHYLIEPGQYQHLDGQHIELTHNQLRIVIDGATNNDHTFIYTIGRIRFLQDPIL